MNIYFCHEWDENAGLLVLARSPAQAKQIYMSEVTADYIDIRYWTVRRGVFSDFAGCLDAGDPALKKFGLEDFYTEDEV